MAEDGQVEDSVPSLLVPDSGASHPDAITCDTQQTLLTLQPQQTSCDKKSSVKDILKKVPKGQLLSIPLQTTYPVQGSGVQTVKVRSCIDLG